MLPFVCSDPDSGKNMRVGRTSAGIELVCQALVNIYKEKGEFPTTEKETRNLISSSTSGYLRSAVRIDGWGRKLRYARTSIDSASAWSLGPMADDAADDIRCSLEVDRARTMVKEVFKGAYSRTETVSTRPMADYRKPWK